MDTIYGLEYIHNLAIPIKEVTMIDFLSHLTQGGECLYIPFSDVDTEESFLSVGTRNHNDGLSSGKQNAQPYIREYESSSKQTSSIVATVRKTPGITYNRDSLKFKNRP